MDRRAQILGLILLLCFLPLASCQARSEDFSNVNFSSKAEVTDFPSLCPADAIITSMVKGALRNRSSGVIEAHRIMVDTRKKVVYLKGEVPDEDTALNANRIARQVRGVRGVVNMLRVRP